MFSKLVSNSRHCLDTVSKNSYMLCITYKEAPPMPRYTCVKQYDITDCGAACLATIAKQHGLKIPITRIREVAGTDRHGTNAYGVVKAAERLGFSAKGVKGDRDAFFSPFPLPCIAHVVVDGSLLHYVVIHRITKKQVVIADPAKGIRKILPEDFFKEWTGVLILMPRRSGSRRATTPRAYGRASSACSCRRNPCLSTYSSRRWSSRSWASARRSTSR
jgi:predicted double-glycine peptidase